MIFIDTNYFLRFLLKQNSEQYAIVRRLFEKGIDGDEQLFTNTLVFFEINWVLKRYYEKKKDEIILFLRKILSFAFIDFSERKFLCKALDIFEATSLDLEDCYHIVYAKENKMRSFATFDKKITNYLKKKVS